MAYKTKELEKQAIKTVSLTDACNYLKEKFKSENEFIDNLLPKLDAIIKEAYKLDVDAIELEKVFDFNDIGYYKIRVDIFVKTKQGIDIVIECKNPSHNKSEIFNSFSQIMSYQFLFTNKKNKTIFILATSVFDFMYFEFMNHFKIDIDLILNNENQAGFWINDLRL